MGSRIDLFKRRKNRNRIALRKKSDRLRLSVFRSANNIYAQIIDDSCGRTLVSSSSLSIKEKISNIEVASKVGIFLAQEAMKQGISKVVFDRGAYLYHGRVKSLADGARSGGLQF